MGCEGKPQMQARAWSAFRVVVCTLQQGYLLTCRQGVRGGLQGSFIPPPSHPQGSRYVGFQSGTALHCAISAHHVWS